MTLEKRICSLPPIRLASEESRSPPMVLLGGGLAGGGAAEAAAAKCVPALLPPVLWGVMAGISKSPNPSNTWRGRGENGETSEKQHRLQPRRCLIHQWHGQMWGWAVRCRCYSIRSQRCNTCMMGGRAVKVCEHSEGHNYTWIHMRAACIRTMNTGCFWKKALVLSLSSKSLQVLIPGEDNRNLWVLTKSVSAKVGGHHLFCPMNPSD